MNSNSSALIIPPPSSATNSAAPNSLAADDIRGIKAPVEIPSGWLWLWCALGALAVAALSYHAWRYWQKHCLKPLTPAVVVTPHERARRKLREALDLIHQPRAFCIRVSDALRLYLEEAFSMRAPERTTEEFLDELQSSALLSFSQKQLLGDFLMRCDLVKFARHEPPVEQLQELYQSALRLVDETSVFIQRAPPPAEPAPPTQSPASTPRLPPEAAPERKARERPDPEARNLEPTS